MLITFEEPSLKSAGTGSSKASGVKEVEQKARLAEQESSSRA